jgi:hypothetical protein
VVAAPFTVEVEDRHEEEDSTKCCDQRVRIAQEVRVRTPGVDRALRKRRLHSLTGVDLHRDTHDRQREEDPHTQHRNEDPNGEKYLLPERAHSLKNARVHHSVVQAEADFKNAEDGDEENRLQSGREVADDGSDCQRPTKSS